MKSSCFSAGLLLAALLCVTPGTFLRASDDLNTLFQMGRSAYYKGDFEQAQALLSQVAARDPRHVETRLLLAQIRSQMKQDGGLSLKKRYEAVQLAKVEFSDVTLQEALDGLKALSKNASGGQVVPNFIVTDPNLNQKTFSLSLTSIPLPEAIQYVAQVSGCRAAYDRHAVLFSSAASVPPPAAETTGGSK